MCLSPVTWMESWRERYLQLTASWASAQQARPLRPVIPPSFSGLTGGNVLFISHRPVETWQLGVARIPKGSRLPVATSACLSSVGVLTAKGRRALQAKGRKEKTKPSAAFMRWRMVVTAPGFRNLLKTVTPGHPIKAFPAIFKDRSPMLFDRSREGKVLRQRPRTLRGRAAGSQWRRWPCPSTLGPWFHVCIEQDRHP